MDRMALYQVLRHAMWKWRWPKTCISNTVGKTIKQRVQTRTIWLRIVLNEKRSLNTSIDSAQPYTQPSCHHSWITSKAQSSFHWSMAQQLWSFFSLQWESCTLTEVLPFEVLFVFVECEKIYSQSLSPSQEKISRPWKVEVEWFCFEDQMTIWKQNE